MEKNIKLVIAKVPEKKSTKKTIRLITDATLRLRRINSQKFILAKPFKEYEKSVTDKTRVSFVDGKTIFYQCFPDCIRVVSKKCDINLLTSEICISTTKMDRISEYLMRALCYDTKHLAICMPDLKEAEQSCEAFYDESGALVKIYDERRKIKSDILIDLNENMVRIGRDIFIDGVGFDFDLGEYSIEELDVMACLNNFDWIKYIKSYKCSKNRLTLLRN